MTDLQRGSAPEPAPNPAPESASGPFREKVLEVRHWTERLFSFRVTRPASFRFRSGEFVMIGLVVEGRPLLRAYSIASPSWDDGLDFYSIKVQDGPLTSRLQHIKPGDDILMGRKPTGTLVLDALTPGERLYLFSTGTGLAPFASIIRDPETYARFSRVILVHGCREAAELDYGIDLVARTRDDPLVGEAAIAQLAHVTTLTRAPHPLQGRVTTLIETGALFSLLRTHPLAPATDRAMICGSMAMLNDTRALLEQAGLKEGSNASPAEYVVERAFVG
jgi:ferredoxin--NADP+ reductase